MVPGGRRRAKSPVAVLCCEAIMSDIYRRPFDLDPELGFRSPFPVAANIVAIGR